MSFAVEPGAIEGDLLIEACGDCHDAGLDPSLSRARFDADLTRAFVSVLLQGPDDLQYSRSLQFRIPDARTSAASTVADALAIGDLDSDGCTDLAVAKSRLIAVFYG